MVYYQSDTKQNMFNSYSDMTPVERSIADFFLSNTEKMDFSSKNISKRLYVSEAALSRFSKKSGYKGYRELIFSYEKDLEYEVPKEGEEADIPVITAALTEDLGKVPGVLARLFRILQVDAPDGQERKAYFQMFWENSFLKAPGKLTADKMAEITKGLSFAQLDDVRMHMNGGMSRLAVPMFPSVDAFCDAVEHGKVALAEKRFRDVTAAVRKGTVSKTEMEVQKNTAEPGTMEVLAEVLKSLAAGTNTAVKQIDPLEEDFFGADRKVSRNIPTDKVLSEDSPMNPDNLDFDL